MAGTALTKQQADKLAQVVSGVKSLPRDESGRKNTERFADKYLRFKLGVRGTGPHAHGLDKEQRMALTTAIRTAFGIKQAERKVGPRKLAVAVVGNPTPKKKRGGKTPSVAQLAKEQTERASGGV